MSLRFYTYNEIAEIFRVKTETVRNWKSKREFQIYGYRRYVDKLGLRRKEALVTEEEVLNLCKKKFIIK